MQNQRSSARTITAEAYELPMPDPERLELARLLWLAANALAEDSMGAWPSTTLPVDTSAEEVKLRRVAEETGAFDSNTAGRVAVGYGLAFEAELLSSHPAAAATAWEAVAREWRGQSCRHLEGYACWRQAEAMLDLRRRMEAEAVLQHAHQVAAGHEPLTGEIVALARRARIDLDAGSPEGSQATGPAEGRAFSLTDRELSVLRLLTLGHTNAEIGRELYMSPKTASVHVTSILRKLAVTGRLQAAVMAERQGLIPSARSSIGR